MVRNVKQVILSRRPADYYGSCGMTGSGKLWAGQYLSADLCSIWSEHSSSQLIPRGYRIIPAALF